MDENAKTLSEIKERVSGGTVGIYDDVCRQHDVEWLIKQAEENEQVRKAYDDRVGDINHLKKIISEIGVAYQSDDENDLDEYLHGLFTNQIDEDY